MIDGHDKAVLQFSGGKDSLALLYLARPHLDSIEVHFGDTGAVFPHVVEFVHRTCEKLGAKLNVVRPDIDIVDFQAQFGLPADIVPLWRLADMRWWMGDPRPPQLIQASTSCCARMLWVPTYQAVIDSGSRLVLRGVKKSDERRGVEPGFVDDSGIEYRFPLWDWTDADVFTYLREQGAEIPEHYSAVNDGLDCWLCTGHTGTHYAADKLSYIRKSHPRLWEALEPRLVAVRDAINAETANLNNLLDEAKDHG